MSILEYSTIFCLISILPSTKGETNNKITVVLSRADPLLQNENTPQTGIGMKIIETFAKKINYNVEYLVIDEILADVFDTEKSFKKLTRFHLAFEKP